MAQNDGQPPDPSSSRNIAYEAGELHRLLVESVKDYAIFALDREGRILSWNPGAERFKGYKAEEVIGKHFSLFYPESRVAEGFPDYELREAARTGRFEDEGWRVRKDGTHFWASVLITALRNSTGDLIGFAKVTRDLTARREAEQRTLENATRVAAEETARVAADAARVQADKLQKLTASLASAHTIPEIAHIIFADVFPAVEASGGALGMRDDTTGRINVVGHAGYHRLPEWSRSLDVDEVLPISEAVRTGKQVVCWTREDRDARFPRLATLLAQYTASVVIPLTLRDHIIGALAMHRDDDHPLADSALQLMEAAAQQVAHALERARLYEAERVARARADEANRAKSEFLAAMSHELRTPLNAIAGYAQLMDMGLHGPVTQDQHDDLQRIKRSQQHLLGIINDILNFARVEAGQTVFEYAPVIVQDVMDAVGGMIAPQAAAKGITFTPEPCAANVVMWADGAKVHQILLNLLSNAVKFTQDGSVTLSCRHTATEVDIVVRDTGIGIPEDHLDRMFEPFIQVGRSLTSTLDGTGLGLAISRDLARAMGGRITVTSVVGEGSVFTLTLPTTPPNQ
jgi:PAS domain S-box-containing protein